MEGSPLQRNYRNDESRTICDTAADLVGESRLRRYVEKHYSDNPEVYERMEKVINYRENFGKLINDAREEIIPYLEAGDIEGADAVVEKYTAMTDEILGKHVEINRAVIALFSMYSGNSEVTEALKKLRDEGGIMGMIEKIWNVTTIEELMKVAYGDNNTADDMVMPETEEALAA